MQLTLHPRPQQENPHLCDSTLRLRTTRTAPAERHIRPSNLRHHGARQPCMSQQDKARIFRQLLADLPTQVRIPSEIGRQGTGRNRWRDFPSMQILAQPRRKSIRRQQLNYRRRMPLDI